MQNKESLLYMKRLIEHLENAWRSQRELSPNMLRRITEFVVGLQDKYMVEGLEKIAEYVVSTMNLHILDLLATFQQSAEQEGISAEDCEETLKYTLPENFRILAEISKSISVRSLDDLVALINITCSLQTLSQTSSAEEAQSWLYELCGMYHRQLMQEKLLTSRQSIGWQTTILTAQQTPHFTDWPSCDEPISNKVQVIAQTEKVSEVAQVPAKMVQNETNYMFAA